MTGIITLLTDFGYVDGYVGAMKGAILSIAPNAPLVDISHDVPAQDVRFGAFTLMTSTDTFPPGTVHVAVVDPGVGSARRALAARAGGSYFVGPDNGVLSWALAQIGGQSLSGDALTVDAGMTAISLDNPVYWRPAVSSTFHGRDVFGPVAAHLSRGDALERMGSPVSSIIAIPFPQVTSDVDRLSGEVLVIDHFGNCVTNIGGDELGDSNMFEIAGRVITRLSRTYEPGVDLVALVGSSGFLEIAAPDGNAADRLGVRIGDTVSARRPLGAARYSGAPEGRAQP